MGMKMTKTIDRWLDCQSPSGWWGFREWKSIDLIHRLIRANHLEVKSSATLQVAIPLLTLPPFPHPLLCPNTSFAWPMTCCSPPMIRFIMVLVWVVLGGQSPGTPQLSWSCGKSVDVFLRQDKEHHPPTFDRWSPLTMTPYPSNAAIKSRSVLPNAREAGIHDLRGTDPIWAGAIISDRSQDRRAMYAGVRVLIFGFDRSELGL